jgi:hypothetical protein
VSAVNASPVELVRDLHSANDPKRVAESAHALVMHAEALLDRGSADAALEVLDTVIAGLEASTDMAPRKVLALALATKSATLKKLGRRHAMRPFEVMIRQHGTKPLRSFMRRQSGFGQQTRLKIANDWLGSF